MLRSFTRKPHTFEKKSTGIFMAAFCPCVSMSGYKLEGGSLPMDLELYTCRRSHCILIQ